MITKNYFYTLNEFLSSNIYRKELEVKKSMEFDIGRVRVNLKSVPIMDTLLKMVTDLYKLSLLC